MNHQAFYVDPRFLEDLGEKGGEEGDYFWTKLGRTGKR